MASEGLIFISNGDGTCYVSDRGTFSGNDLIIPERSPGGDLVTAIGEGAFENTGIKTVSIPSGVTVINNNAFRYCTSMGSISLPNTLVTIGQEAFSVCKALANITIPDSVTSIGYRAFSNCTALASITIPDSVTSIGGQAFSYCSSLTSITIFDSVTSIGDYAFSNCTALTSITIPDSVTSIGRWAFDDCTSLLSVTIGRGVTLIGRDAFEGCKVKNVYYNGDVEGWLNISFENTNSNPVKSNASLYFDGREITNIIVPDSITSIASDAFYGCKNIKNLIIGKNVTSINSAAFALSSLESVVIPISVTSIKTAVFNGCRDLETIYYTGTEEQWNSITKGENWDASAGSGTEKGTYTVEFIEEPEPEPEPNPDPEPNAKTISGVWRYVGGNVTIPDEGITQDILFSIKSIGQELAEPATYYVSQIQITKQSAKATVYKVESTYEYDVPMEVDISNVSFVADLGDEPQTVSDQFFEFFMACSKPESYKTITAGQYRINKTISQFPGAIETVVEPIEFYCSGYSRGNGNLYTAYCSGIIIGHNSLRYAVYKTTPDYPGYVPNLVLTHLNSEYFDGLVYDDPLLITVPRDITVSASFFEWFENNTIATYKVNVSYGDRVISNLIAGQTATLKCAGMKMESDVAVKTHIVESEKTELYDGSYTKLKYSEGLEFRAIDGGYEVAGIGECADTYVVIPSEHNELPVISIGDHAFEGCARLRGVEIPDSVTSIGSYAFDGCVGLVYATIPDSVKTIQYAAFLMCYKLASITIPDSVTNLGASMFSECYSLASVKIGNGISKINSSTFAFCTKLKSIKIPTSVTEIHWRAFYGCTALTDIYVPWGEGEVADAPWSAENATIHYNSEV